MGALRLVSLEESPLDAYSRVVTEVARRLSPSVVNLRVQRGSGSGVVITPDGFLLSSAHVVRRAKRGVASFVDGSELTVEIVGADPLSDLAVLRAEPAALQRPSSATRPASRSASSSSRSGTRTALPVP